MNIRKAKIDDIENNLLDLYIDGFRYHYNGRPDIFSNQDEVILKNDLINTITNSNVLILESDKKILGFAVYQIKEKHDKVMWIDQLIIDEYFRHRGYGEKIIDRVTEIAKNEKCKRIEFSCWSFNKNALEMYKHIGYKEQKVIFEKNI